jgi:hypothetical protein
MLSDFLSFLSLSLSLKRVCSTSYAFGLLIILILALNRSPRSCYAFGLLIILILVLKCPKYQLCFQTSFRFFNFLFFYSPRSEVPAVLSDFIVVFSFRSGYLLSAGPPTSCPKYLLCFSDVFHHQSKVPVMLLDYCHTPWSEVPAVLLDYCQSVWSEVPAMLSDYCQTVQPVAPFICPFICPFFCPFVCPFLYLSYHFPKTLLKILW